MGMTSPARARSPDRAPARGNGIDDERVLNAIRTVPRHLFVDEALATRAYEDTALPIGHGQTISQPWVVARMTEALLENGAAEDGCWRSAPAPATRPRSSPRWGSRCTPSSASATCCGMARKRFRTLGLNMRSKHDDGRIGWPEEGPFDAHHRHRRRAGAGGCADRCNLRPAARLVAPVGSAAAQSLLCLRKDADGGIEQRDLAPVVFVPLLSGMPIESRTRMKLFGPLYERALDWSRAPARAGLLTGLSFVEAIMFPVMPEVMLAPMCLAQPQARASGSPR